MTVDTFSNEFELEKSIPQVAHVMPVGDTKYNVWMASSMCVNGANAACVVDNSAPDRRFYTTRITATDQAGLTASTTCQVEIIPQGNNGNQGANQSPSQKFLLASDTDSAYAPDP